LLQLALELCNLGLFGVLVLLAQLGKALVQLRLMQLFLL
jgi:hypothetical protein